MPRRIVSILEGESLVNDATAIVALRTALAALVGTITIARVGFEFLVAAGGGVLVGLIGARVLVIIRRRVQHLVLDTTLSLLVPFAAYLAAEEISIAGAHSSGVLAVVIIGVILGHRSMDLQSASSRLAEQINWQTVQFVLENAMFLLIGLQLRTIIEDADRSGLGWPRLIAICVIVLVAAMVARLLWVFPATYVPRRLFRRIRVADPAPPWTYPLIVSWAGMRGVVTLAAVFALPVDTPRRPALVLAAFAVVAGTLIIQGGTLPALVRRLRLPGPDAAEDALAAANALQVAARAGLARLDELSDGVPDDVIDRLRNRTLDRANWAWERLGRQHEETPSETYRRIRLEMLAAERQALGDLRRGGDLDEDVRRDVQRLLDVEESLLDQLKRWTSLPIRRCTPTVVSAASTSPRRGQSKRSRRPAPARAASARGRRGSTCDCAWPVASSDAATRLHAATPTPTSSRRTIP